MEMPRRHGFKWTVNEILKLQREYELLDLPVEEIAFRHERSVNSIMQKIIEEDFLYISDEDEYVPEHPQEESNEDENDCEYDVVVNNDGEISYHIYNRANEDNQNEEVLCIAEKKEPLNPGSPQRTIRAYEYLRDSFIGFFFNTTK